MEIDEHGWLQENARDTPTPPTQPLVGPSKTRRHSLGVERASTGLSYSSAYDTPEKVCGRTVTMVTVRPQQMLMNTRAKRRTAASRQPVLYAGVRPPDCRSRSRYAPLPRRSIARSNNAISGRVGLGIGIISVMGCRRTVQVTNPGTGLSEAAELERVLRTHFQLVGHMTTLRGIQPVHSASVGGSGVYRNSYVSPATSFQTILRASGPAL